MATETEKSTREQVEELFNAGTTEAKDIAEKLGKNQGTVYVHLRNIQKDRGIKPRGRGRPPANKDGKAQESKSEGKTEGKATRPAPRKAPNTSKTTEQKSAPTAKQENGHVTGADRFPLVAEAIERQISEKERELEALRNMLAGLTK